MAYALSNRSLKTVYSSDTKSTYFETRTDKQKKIFASISKTKTYATSPNSRVYTTGGDWVKFQVLLIKWQREKALSSSISAMCMAPSYQRIIAMGPKAVPFIIKQLVKEKDEPDYWFWALKALTDQDPVPSGDRGNIRKMAHHWIEWAKKDSVYN